MDMKKITTDSTINKYYPPSFDDNGVKDIFEIYGIKTNTKLEDDIIRNNTTN
jgi:hypothetical protein